MKAKLFLLIGCSFLTITSCELNVEPSDAVTTTTLVTTSDGLRNAVNGAYALFKDHISFNGQTDQNLMYLRQYYHLSDFASDDIVSGQVTTDPLYNSFSLDHSPAQTNTRYFWYISYKIINGLNTVIDAAEKIDNPDAATQQLLGECYFLRAFCHFNLVRFYAKPYTHNPDAPGIILRTSLDDDAQKARATVKEVYAAVIADAEKGATLMTQPRGVQYASQAAAWSLLSRVYLYQEENQKALDFATRVINSNKYTLETAASYPALFANATASQETIWAIAFTNVDDYGKFGSIASMIYSNGNSGWGEEFASPSLRALMSAHPEDVRWSYIVPLRDENNAVKKLNGLEIYYISKFSGQNGSPTLSSPIMFRLAEIYLTRAEANAKLGNTAAALQDVDIIRQNRGLANALYQGQLPANQTALDVVLQERRLELAFEGHRTFDVYRNKRNLDRTYWGYHLPGLKESDINLAQQPGNYPNLVVNWDNPRIIYYLPIDEILTNKLAQQNE